MPEGKVDALLLASKKCGLSWVCGMPLNMAPAGSLRRTLFASVSESGTRELRHRDIHGALRLSGARPDPKKRLDGSAEVLRHKFCNISEYVFFEVERIFDNLYDRRDWGQLTQPQTIRTNPDLREFYGNACFC